MEFVPDKNVVSKITCCECGIVIDKNPLNTCIQCLQSKVDITEGISKQGILQFCNKCDRYLQPPNNWIKAALESRQLLSLCLKRIKGLNKVKLVDAGFIWTEPHSKRVKVKSLIQREHSGALLQQNIITEFVVMNQTCDECHRVEAKDYWNAVVQVRQHVEHKKTFYYIEQLIIKLKMHESTVSIKQVHDGIDFFYANQQTARKMVDFLESVVPCRTCTSKRMISQDVHSNTYNNKHTFSLEIAPICRDNIVCLPHKLSKENGGFGPIAICTKVTRNIHLIDPKRGRTIDIDAVNYWRYPFKAICSQKQYCEYTVMEVEESGSQRGKSEKSGKEYRCVDVWVMKTRDVGKSDQQYHTKTHLGNWLSVGDVVLGFDFANANLNEENLEKLSEDQLPDVLLVKKIYSDEQTRHKKRKLKLKRLDVEREGSVATSEERDYAEFLDEIEEDVELRDAANVIESKDVEEKIENLEISETK